MSPFPPIRDLIPHGEAIRQLERLVEWAPGRAECAMRVEETSRLVVDGRLESVLLLEPMAQAVAACLNYEAYLGGEGVRIGMIVACRALEVHVPFVPVGMALRIRALRVRGDDASSHFDCEVWREGEGTEEETGAGEPGSAGERALEAGPIATATLTLFHDRSR